MIPLIDEAIYANLVKVRRAMDDGATQLARPFVPVGPDPAASGPLRLLFVGQTSYQWGDSEVLTSTSDDTLTLSQAASIYSEDLNNQLLKNNRSPFWQTIRAICERVLQTIGAPEWAARDRLREVVGWSNVVKIHRIQMGTHNPPADFVAKQRQICCDSLRMEVRNAQPTAIILMNGGTFGHEIVSEVFGQDSAWWQNSEDWGRVAGQHNREFATTVLWANHPGSMRRKKQDKEDLGFIAGFIAATVLGGAVAATAK